MFRKIQYSIKRIKEKIKFLIDWSIKLHFEYIFDYLRTKLFFQNTVIKLYEFNKNKKKI